LILSQVEKGRKKKRLITSEKDNLRRGIRWKGRNAYKLTHGVKGDEAPLGGGKGRTSKKHEREGRQVGLKKKRRTRESDSTGLGTILRNSLDRTTSQKRNEGGRMLPGSKAGVDEVESHVRRKSAQRRRLEQRKHGH